MRRLERTENRLRMKERTLGTESLMLENRLFLRRLCQEKGLSQDVEHRRNVTGDLAVYQDVEEASNAIRSRERVSDLHR